MFQRNKIFMLELFFHVTSQNATKKDWRKGLFIKCESQSDSEWKKKKANITREKLSTLIRTYIKLKDLISSIKTHIGTMSTNFKFHLFSFFVSNKRLDEITYIKNSSTTEFFKFFIFFKEIFVEALIRFLNLFNRYEKTVNEIFWCHKVSQNLLKNIRLIWKSYYWKFYYLLISK